MRWPWQHTWNPPIYEIPIYDRNTGRDIRWEQVEAGAIVAISKDEDVDLLRRRRIREGHWSR